MPDDQGFEFIHVIGSVNLAERSGEIDYVVPATSGAQHQKDAGDDQIWLDIRDKSGNVLDSVSAVLRRPSCDGGIAQYGLIQENLPRIEGMADVVLRVGDTIVDTYAPPAQGLAAAVGAAFTAAAGVVGLGGFFPPSGRRQRSYTVQIRPESDEVWQTIAVNSTTPDVEVDISQFPGADRLYRRVLEADGFGWKVVSEREIAPAQPAAAGLTGAEALGTPV